MREDDLATDHRPVTGVEDSGILSVVRIRVSVRTLAFGLMLATALGAASPRPASAQEKPSIVTLVPTADWQLTTSQTADSSALAPWDGDAAIEHEYGVSSYAVRTYEFENHKADVLVEQAPDASSAYGLLTFYRTPAMVAMAGLPLTLAASGKALLARGPAFIRVSVSAPEALPLGDFMALLRVVGGPPPPPRALEQLPAPLPSRDRVRGSEKYVLGPLAAARTVPALPASLIGFDQGAEVQTAQYVTSAEGSASGTLTLAAINYPTPQIARSVFDSISKALCQSTESSRVFECARQDTYVLVAMNAPSRAAAVRFLKGFKVSKTISEDQGNPGNQATVYQMLQLLIANGVLICLLVVFSLTGGILVFVSKRLARKWFGNSILVEGEGAGIVILNLSDLGR